MSEFIGTKLTMNLGERSYDIIVKSGSLENLYQFARLDRRVAVVTDSGVPAQYAQMVADQCKDAHIITVPQGEASKSFKILESVLKQMLEFGMGRGDLVIAVGGGVVGDLAGFAASIYMRGIDFINCPTTTLSMIDSSIGGKTAVDLGDTKNIVGAFWQPKLVIVDPDTLSTLPRRHFINGLAEAVKASLLADPELFAIFENGDVDAQIGEIICRSLRFKKNIVEQDETEQGMRKALNFGHTIGHGIEAVKGIKGRRTVGLYHGECVALGMLPMIESKALQKRVRAVYRRLGLPTRTTYDKEKVLAEMLHDKKAQSGQITIIKVPGLGCWRAEIDTVDAQLAALFERRMAAVLQVAEYKRAHGLPVYDAARETAVLEKAAARIQDPALRPYYKDHVQNLMDVAKQYEAVVLGQNRAAYQGVEGAFAHIALRALFPHAEAVSYPTWDEVFDAVERGDAARGVVPFENSHAGDVSAVLDLCYNHPALWVVDVYDLPISQNLLVLPGTKLDQIKSVYSHQQAIAQSETFLRQFGLPATAMANTAMAAKFVAESGDSSKAAIASVETAALYGLEVLVPSINTDGDNTTRFIVLSREKPTGGNRFSLLFTVDNKPGKLGEVIQIIGASGFNMESIKSRPMPHVPFEYYFYVELVGDPTADETAALLRELDRTCRTVRLLGVYTK